MAQRTQQLRGSADSALPRAGSLDAAALARTQLRSNPGYWHRAWRRFRRNRVALVAFCIAIAIVLFVLGAPLISHYVTHNGYANNHLADKLKPPFSKGYILGSDGNGRDVLTRLAYGGRVSLLIAFLGSLSLLLIGGSIGGIAGFTGGIVDSILMRTADVLLSVPTLALLILISALYRPGPAFLALFIALTGWSGIARLIRGEVLRLRSQDFVEASRVLGASNARILLRHIFPNVVPIIVVWASLVVPTLILVEASLSYLGVGVRVPTPSWGNMLQDAKQFYRVDWQLIFIPGFMIYISVLSINLVGSGLRDALDPRLNQ
jgi:peptide/nickel transport system permease protein